MFAEDESHTLWTSGHSSVFGWLDTRRFDETGDEAASQGWTPLILDTNGNGRRDDYTGPDESFDPELDRRITPGYVYGIAPAPDGSVWASILTFPSGVVRLVPGENPPETALAELYEVPWEHPEAPTVGYGPRGMDVDRDGVVWAPMASGHMASFDRRTCEGPLDGLGAGTPINTGNASEGLLARVDGEWVVLRVPYPLGFYTKWMDGRIDDTDAGWKGRGLWATVSTRAPFHMETGEGTTSKVFHFQIRPDPLAD